MNNLVIPLPIIILVHKMKWTIFIKRSTITKMESWELEGGRSMMKSKEFENHGDTGIGNGWKGPWEWWRGFFAQTQTS